MFRAYTVSIFLNMERHLVCMKPVCLSAGCLVVALLVQETHKEDWWFKAGEQRTKVNQLA